MVLCVVCKTKLSNTARYCSNCGKNVSSLRWRNANSKDVELLNIEHSSKSISIQLQNSGATPIAVKMDPRRAEINPWIDMSTTLLRNPTAVTLMPGATTHFDLHFDVPVLDSTLDKLAVLPIADTISKLYFITSNTMYENNEWKLQYFPLEVCLSRLPFAQPPMVLYRYINWEQTKQKSFIHTVQVCNYGSEPISIRSISIEDTATFIPYEVTFDIEEEEIDKIERVHASSVISYEQSDSINTIAPREITDISFHIDSPQNTGKLCRFNGEIRFELSTGDTIVSICAGVIGNAPRIELFIANPNPTPLNPEIRLPYNPLHTDIHLPIEFNLYNPGDLPIKLTGVSIFKSDESGTKLEKVKQSSTDWLVFQEEVEGIVLKPKGTYKLLANIDPNNRKSEHQQSEYGYRCIQFNHGNEDLFPSIFPVQVRLGKVVRATTSFIGIDFGTTNSVVCFADQEDSDTTKLLNIAPGREGGKTPSQMRSLLWYNSDKHHPFYFGDKAMDASGQELSNLVRSMKTIVNRNPEEKVAFIHKEGASSQIKSWKAKQLLDYFIIELRERAENSLSILPDIDRERLGLDGQNIRLVRAIFTHPVDMPDDALQTLMESSHKAGLNLECNDLKEFKEDYCVDESTAAVISFVRHFREEFEEYDEIYEAQEQEKILCVDIGGGTSDIATVQLIDDAGSDLIQLIRSYGDSYFGGDDIDLSIAKYVIEQIKEQLDTDSDIEDVDFYRRALGYYTVESFTRSYCHDQNQSISLDRSRYEEDKKKARQIFSYSQDLKTGCERAKIELSTGNQKAKVNTSSICSIPEVTISREWYHKELQNKITTIYKIIDTTLKQTSWKANDVTILLFTGQTSRIAKLRELVIQHLTKLRGGEDAFLVVDAESTNFCPKSCVAKGAALFQCVRSDDSMIIEDHRDKPWPPIEDGGRKESKLRITILNNRNPRRGQIEGLEEGESLPASGKIGPLRSKRDQFNLFKMGDRKPFARIEFDTEVVECNIVINSINPADISATSGEVKGTVTIL
jgi:molecular chaperone DnaK (HSP70)